MTDATASSDSTDPIAIVFPGQGSQAPGMGKLVAGDASSYSYLVESIRLHPPQAVLKQMLEDAGFGAVEYHNLVGGIAAIHRGVRP